MVLRIRFVRLGGGVDVEYSEGSLDADVPARTTVENVPGDLILRRMLATHDRQATMQ